MWFLAGFRLGADLTLGYGNVKEGQPTTTSITMEDGSWAEVSLAEDHGVHQVTEGGRRRVWHIIEDAHTLWTALGRPGWDRLGAVLVVQAPPLVWLGLWPPLG